MERVVLSVAELATAVRELNGWRVEDGMLRRRVELPDFPAAIAFVGQVADLAEEMNHHPDIDIRWRTVHLALATHDRGGITDVDIEQARRVDALLAAT